MKATKITVHEPMRCTYSFVRPGRIEIRYEEGEISLRSALDGGIRRLFPVGTRFELETV